ncbi:MAG: hypothetical protein ACK5UR_03205 [Armatimonadota bacterium]|jgi:hypothetical protein
MDLNLPFFNSPLQEDFGNRYASSFMVGESLASVLWRRVRRVLTEHQHYFHSGMVSDDSWEVQPEVPPGILESFLSSAHFGPSAQAGNALEADVIAKRPLSFQFAYQESWRRSLYLADSVLAKPFFLLYEECPRNAAYVVLAEPIPLMEVLELLGSHSCILLNPSFDWVIVNAKPTKTGFAPMILRDYERSSMI